MATAHLLQAVLPYGLASAGEVRGGEHAVLQRGTPSRVPDLQEVGEMWAKCS